MCPCPRSVGISIAHHPRTTCSLLESGRRIAGVQSSGRHLRRPVGSPLALWPWRRLIAGLRGGPGEGDLDAVSHTDVQPVGGLPAPVYFVVFEIGHGEGLTGSGRELIETLHR